MAHDSKRKSLGRGLSSLIPGASGVSSLGVSSLLKKEANEKVLMLPIEKIQRDEDQPRELFDQEELVTLADSIRENGLIQPIIVRRDGDIYKIIAGERRWRATQMVGLKEIASIVRNIDSEQASILALIENLHRSNLNPIEEAKGYRRLQDEFGKNHDEIAEKVGKERSSITNSLRLLSLPDEAQDALISRTINMGHAKVLLGLEDEEELLQVLNEVVNQGLSVRDTEKLVSKLKDAGRTASSKKKPRSTASTRSANTQIRLFEEKLHQALEAKVKIVQGSRSKGKIEIRYSSNEELQRVLNKIAPNSDEN